MDHDIRFYCIIALLALLTAACILTLNVILILVDLAVSAVLIAFYKLYYVFEAILFKRTNLIQVIENCELSRDRSTAIRRHEGKFCSISVAYLETTTTNNVDRDKVEKVIANSNCPFRFLMHVERIDIDKLVDNLQTKRSMREIELGKLGGSGEKSMVLKANALKRQIEQLDREIEKISTGGAPLRMAQYIMTSAVSENRITAQERSKSQIRELASEFGAIIGSKSTILSGSELLDVLRFDSGVIY